MKRLSVILFVVFCLAAILCFYMTNNADDRHNLKVANSLSLLLLRFADAQGEYPSSWEELVEAGYIDVNDVSKLYYKSGEVGVQWQFINKRKLSYNDKLIIMTSPLSQQKRRIVVGENGYVAEISDHDFDSMKMKPSAQETFSK